MQSLFPTSPTDLGRDDLLALYAYPHDRFWVRANVVSTLDGAAQGGDHKSGSLSSPADHEVFAVLRTLADVVLVGANTTRVEGYQPVRADEVDAAARARLGLAPVPAIAVVTRSLDVDPALAAGGEAPTLAITTAAAPADRLRRWAETAPVLVAGDASVDLSTALDQLAARGYRRVLCEGGPSLLRDLAASGRLDELCLTLTPQLAAGDRLRLTSGASLSPPVSLRLRHLLESEGELFARYTRD